MVDSTLSFYEYRFGGGDTMRWWGHSNPILYKRICLNILQSQTAAPKLSLTISTILDGSQFFMKQQLKQYVFFKYGIVLCLQKRVSLFFYFYIHEKVVIK